MLSPHFATKELWCRHCHQLKIDPRLLPALEELREVLRSETGADAKIGINSGYRCAAHNASLPSASPNSKHVQGTAADCRPINASLKQLYNAALLTPAFNAGGIGLYPAANFLHVDLGPRRRWGWLGGMTTLERALRSL
jgi:uncharacterized protein YcbK (DUF882 family)